MLQRGHSGRGQQTLGIEEMELRAQWQASKVHEMNPGKERAARSSSAFRSVPSEHSAEHYSVNAREDTTAAWGITARRITEQNPWCSHRNEIVPVPRVEWKTSKLMGNWGKISETYRHIGGANFRQD